MGTLILFVRMLFCFIAVIRMELYVCSSFIVSLWNFYLSEHCRMFSPVEGNAMESQRTYWGNARGNTGEILGKCWGDAGEMLGKYWGNAMEVLGTSEGNIEEIHKKLHGIYEGMVNEIQTKT